ncbi:2937_t:CDS:2, partial [Diversispora eburnea]
PSILISGIKNKLSEQKKEEIAEDFIKQITYSFGTKRNDQVEEAVKAYSESNAFQTVTTNAYNKGKEYWAESWGHYLTRRVYQEKFSLKREE